MLFPLCARTTFDVEIIVRAAAGAHRPREGWRVPTWRDRAAAHDVRSDVPPLAPAPDPLRVLGLVRAAEARLAIERRVQAPGGRGRDRVEQPLLHRPAVERRLGHQLVAETVDGGEQLPPHPPVVLQQPVSILGQAGTPTGNLPTPA